jgi:acetyl esterase/lipase
MTKNYFLLFAILCLTTVNFVKAQIICNGQRYVLEEFTVAAPSTVTYGQNLDLNGANVVLTMDIYEPTGDTISHRPCLFFTHGGSFIGGTKTDADVVELCQRFAKLGYVTVSIDYRLGIGLPIAQPTATVAVVRGMQDMKAAIRYMRKDAATSNLYKIDSNLIFGGGSSAGALCAIHAAYLDDVAEIPSYMNMNATGCSGGLEGNSGNLGYSSKVKAVVNLCGAIGSKYWIKPNEEPICNMHGTADNVVPYGTSTIYIGGIFPVMVVDGSKTIDTFCVNQGGPYSIMHTWPAGVHVPYLGNNMVMDETVNFVKAFLYKQMGCGEINGANESLMLNNEPLFANPTSQNLILDITNYDNVQTVELIDLHGKVISINKAIDNSIEVKRPANNGIYFIKLISNQHTITVKKVIFI